MMRRVAAALALAPVLAAAEGPPLVDYVVVDAAEIPAPLVVGPADPAAGAALVEAAGCAACHDGRAAARLAAAAAGLTTGARRLALVEPRIRRPDTRMPSYYAVGVFGEDPAPLVGRTRMTAAEIEDVLAYLATLAPPADATKK